MSQEEKYALLSNLNFSEILIFLRDTIGNMEKQGMELIKKNAALTSEMKLLERENKNLDSMVNRMTKNMDFLMEQNEKIKQMYKDEIERLKAKIEFMEGYRKKKEEKEKNKENDNHHKTNDERFSIQSAITVTNELEKLMKINEDLEKENQFLKKNLQNPEILLDEYRNQDDFRSIFTQVSTKKTQFFQGSFKVIDFKNLENLENSSSKKKSSKKKKKKDNKLRLELKSDAILVNPNDGKSLMKKSLTGSKSARARYAEYAGTEENPPYCALI